METSTPCANNYKWFFCWEFISRNPVNQLCVLLLVLPNGCWWYPTVIAVINILHCDKLSSRCRAALTAANPRQHGDNIELHCSHQSCKLRSDPSCALKMAVTVLWLYHCHSDMSHNGHFQNILNSNTRLLTSNSELPRHQHVYKRSSN